MSMPAAPGDIPKTPDGPGTGSAVVSVLQNIVTAINGLSSAFSAGRARVSGRFTLANASTTVVTQSAAKIGSAIQITPVNATAGTLMGSTKSLFVSAVAIGSFTVATADGTNAAGTEQFQYTVFNQ